MATLEVRSVPNLLGTPVSYAYAVKAGPWIFLTGHEAFDFERGVPEEVAGPSGFPLFGRLRNRREGDFILQRMRRTLREFGSDLGNGVRLDQYYPTPAAVDPYHLARHAEFGDYIPPSTSVVMERCFGADNNISTSLIAAMPGHEIHKIHPPGVGSEPSSGLRAGRGLRRLRLRRWADGAQCGAGARPAGACSRPFGLGRQRDPQADRIYHPGETVSPEFAALSHAGYTQAVAIYDYAEALCRIAGTSMRSALRLQYFVSNLTAFPGVAMAWSAKMGAQPHPFVCIRTPPAMPAPGLVLIADFWISTL